jgi:hypothetical protein
MIAILVLSFYLLMLMSSKITGEAVKLSQDEYGEMI